MLETFKQIDRSRYEVEVVCKEPGPLTDELARLRIPVFYAPSLDRAIHPWRDFKAYRELCKIFAARKYDVVHTHSSKPGVLGRLAARHVGVCAVVHQVHAFAFHEYSPWYKRWLYSGIERLVARHCDRMLFVNSEERDLVVRRGWLPAADCLTVYNGADLDVINPQCPPAPSGPPVRWQVGNDEIIILFMGRLEYPKQPLLLAEIADRLERLRPHEAWRLVVAGSGPEEAGLRRAVGALGWNIE